MYRPRAVFFAAAGLVFMMVISARVRADDLAAAARQLIVCIAPQNSSFEGTLQLFQRDPAGAWQPDGGNWPVLFAPRGLAWGRGLNPPQEGPQKVSNDHRNPAGLFRIGFALGYAPYLPHGAHGWTYHQVTDRDAWIDDPTLPGYNHLYTLPVGAPEPAWWHQQRMHMGDHAYQWMLLIEHNYDNAVPNGGTEIFFHIRRGEHYRTAGCTTMKEDDLLKIIKWLRPGSNAMLAELSRADYERVWQAWHLPPPTLALPRP
jgi:L,D-peptidoglycan transpeptidase YkuD (ErfK/YbiS/YcfS/YnhG family)